MVHNYDFSVGLTILMLFVIIIINVLVVHRSNPRGGLQFDYTESPGKKCGWLPHKFETEGLVDLKAEVLGYTHSHSALQLMWSFASSCGGAASHAA